MDCVCRDILCIDCVYRDILCMDCVYRDIIYIDCAYRDILCMDCVYGDIVLPGERTCDFRVTYVCLQPLELDSWNRYPVI